MECPPLGGPQKKPIVFQVITGPAKVVDPASAGWDTPAKRPRNLLFQGFHYLFS